VDKNSPGLRDLSHQLISQSSPHLQGRICERERVELDGEVCAVADAAKVVRQSIEGWRTRHLRSVNNGARFSVSRD